MSPYVPENVEAYAERYTTARADLFDRLGEETRATQTAPQMMVGTVEGAFLSFLVTMTNAKRVLEVGTFTGWSSIAMARALPLGGSIVTCDVNEETTAIARRYAEEAGVADRIDYHLGPGLETIDELDGPFDLVFIDADKVGYPAYLTWAGEHLREGGVVLGDNAFGFGEIHLHGGDEGRIALRLFNEQLARGGIPFHAFEVEVTETVLLGEARGVAATLQRLHDNGVKISLDDFGTGYASLTHLKRFPVDELKIDRSFVSGLGDRREAEALVSGIINLGHGLELEVVADGRMPGGAEEGRRAPGLRTPHATRLVGREHGAAAVAGEQIEVMGVIAGALQQEQRAGHDEFDIVGVCGNGNRGGTRAGHVEAERIPFSESFQHGGPEG